MDANDQKETGFARIIHSMDEALKLHQEQYERWLSRNFVVEKSGRSKPKEPAPPSSNEVLKG